MEPDPLSESTEGDLRQLVNEKIGTNRFDEAATLAIKLAELCPGDAGVQRMTSSLLSQVSKPDLAKKFAIAAARLAPDNSEFLIHAGVVLNQNSEFTEAIRFLMLANRLAPDNAEICQQLSFAAEKLGNFDLAARLSALAYQRDPDSQFRGVALAYTYAKKNDFDLAAQTLEMVIQRFGPSSSVLRAQSGFLLQCRQPERSLEVIDQAISLQPDVAEFYLHRTSVLYELGRYSDRKDAVLRALHLAPDDKQVRRHAVSVFVECGDVNEALKRAAALLSEYPEEDEYVSCMRFLLEARDGKQLSTEIGDIAALKANVPRQLQSNDTSFWTMATTQINVIGALVLRDIRSRYGESKISFLWILLEPLLHIGILAIAFQYTMHGRPPLGNNYFQFYFTGVMPYLLLSHLIMHNGQTIKGNRYMMQIPTVTPIDLIVAKSIVELFVTAVVYVIFTLLFSVFGIQAVPNDIVSVFGAFGLTFVLGMGLGAVCATLQEFGSLFEHAVGIIVRGAYFVSGIFYAPAMMPASAREIIAWNPFLHMIDMNRIGYYLDYKPHWYDPFYAMISALFSLIVGFACVALMSRTMRLPK